MINIEHFEAELLHLLHKHRVPLAVVLFPGENGGLYILGGCQKGADKPLNALYDMIVAACEKDGVWEERAS